MDFKDAKKAIKGNRALPQSFDKFFDCQQGRWYRGIQWIWGRVKLVPHWSCATVQKSIALHGEIRPSVWVTWGCGWKHLCHSQQQPARQGLAWMGWVRGCCLGYFQRLFHAVTSLWEFSSAAFPASLGSKAVRTAPANKRCTTAGGFPPWFINCGPRFYLAELLHSQYKFNAVSDAVYGNCTLTFNYIKSYYNHFLYNKSSLTPEKLSSHGCSAVFLKSKTEEF